MKTIVLLGAFCALFLVSGCQILGPDHSDIKESTYPAAFDLPDADFANIMDGLHEPGRFNLTVYVVGISECPPDHACLIADNIQVAESPFTDGIPLMIDAQKPSQFTLESQYVLSLEIFEEAFPETEQRQYVQVLAYSPVD